MIVSIDTFINSSISQCTVLIDLKVWNVLDNFNRCTSWSTKEKFRLMYLGSAPLYGSNNKKQVDTIYDEYIQIISETNILVPKPI